MAAAEIMAKLDGLEAVLDFLKRLQPKIVAQIAKKVMSLSVAPFPADRNDTSSTYQEILDLLIDRPTSMQIINFKVSAASQSRLQTLRQKNRETALTAAEAAEIDLYQLDTLIGFLKIRAYAALQATPQN